jgi:glycosyltransferase involved in cell wall biosynthesis
MNDKKNIFFVSISCDMYGSSKVLLSLVLQLKKQSDCYHPIVCMPYGEGPLKDILKTEGVRMIEMPVVKLTRSMLKSLNFIAVFRAYFRAKKIFKRETMGMTIDCIQSNTLATLFGAMYCFFRKPKHLVHVHEIMDRPKIASFFFKNVLRFFSDAVVYNSIATEEFYNGIAGSLRKKSSTILNGVDRTEAVTSEEKIKEIRQQHFRANSSHFLIGLIGRINRLKGHSLLLAAFEDISEKHPNAQLCFVGSAPPNQEFYLTNLQDEVQNSKVANKVHFIDFQDQIFSILESLDLVVVPSTEPESFGLIVVEAMLAKKAVIGSNIGGISTIIDHNETGLLFEPNNKNELAAALTNMIENRDAKQQIETRAYHKAMEVYSTNSMYQKFNQLYNTLL